MKARRRQVMLLGDVLMRVFHRASTTVFGDRVGLYLVGLMDPGGFALALAVHERVPGPDPAVLRERAEMAGIQVPMMVGAAPAETLARAAESLRAGEHTARKLLGVTVRTFHRDGEVPVVVMSEGAALVRTLAILAPDAGRAADGSPSHGTMIGDNEEIEIQGWTVPIGVDGC